MPAPRPPLRQTRARLHTALTHAAVSFHLHSTAALLVPAPPALQPLASLLLRPAPHPPRTRPAPPCGAGTNPHQPPARPHCRPRPATPCNPPPRRRRPRSSRALRPRVRVDDGQYTVSDASPVRMHRPVPQTGPGNRAVAAPERGTALRSRRTGRRLPLPTCGGRDHRAGRAAGAGAAAAGAGAGSGEPVGYR